MSFDLDLLRIVTTLLSLTIFIGICVWALARRNQARFDAAARLPFEHDDAATQRDAA